MASTISKFIKQTKHKTKLALNNDTSAINLIFSLFITMLFLLKTFVSINLIAFSAALFSLFVLYKKNTALLDLKNYLPLGLMFAFIISTFISSYALPTSTHHGFTWLFLWLSCFLTGFIFSKTNPNHNYFFITPALVVLIITFFICMLGYYLDFVDTIFNTDFPNRLNLFVLSPFNLAIFGTFCALYSLNRVLCSNNRTTKIFYFFCFLTMLLIVNLTYYKSTMYILTFTLITSLLLLPGARKTKIIIFLSLIAVALIFILSISEKRRSFLASAIKNPLQHSTIQSRIPLWAIGKELFVASPYFGHGLRSYVELHPKYVKTHEAELNQKYPYYEKAVRHTHNFILSRLVETGLVGCTLFLTLFVITVIYAFKAPLEQRWLACFFVFYFLVGIIDDPLVRTNDAYIFILMGLVTGRPQPKTAKQLKSK